MRLRILLIVCTLCSAMFVSAQRAQNVADNVRRKTDVYEYGEGYGATPQAARKSATFNLAQKFSVTVTNKQKESYIRNDDSESLNISDEELMTTTLRIVGMETLEWEETIKDSKGNEEVRCHAFCYVNRQDMADAAKERVDRINEMINNGIEQEKLRQIGPALRYYNWAYTLIQCFKDDVRPKIDGQEKIAAVWLPAKIESVLHNIEFKVNEGEMIYSPDEYDKYTVGVDVTYNGDPIQSVDFKYFNGERNIDAMAKNGASTLKFVDLSNMNDFIFKVEYAYADQAAKSYDEEIQAACSSGSAFDSNSRVAQHRIPITIKKDKIKVNAKLAKEEEAQRNAELSTEAAAMAPAPANTVAKLASRPVCDDQSSVEKIMAVEEAIRSKKYDSVSDLFTPEAYETFRRMTNKNNLTINRKKGEQPTYRIESTSLFKYGTGIPVTLKHGRNKIWNERIVFRFDHQTGLIKGVAYALSDRAEQDIFREASWDINSRYSLLTFMEDYQTAFCTKHIDFIRDLFSDNAIIIVGNKNDKASSVSGMKDVTEIPAKQRPKFTFKQLTKQEYINNLAGLFKRESWIKVNYEENQIAKAVTSGLLNHEVLWIEIRQNWDSSSGYNDTGFLALQINMKEKGSQINVRTFTPEFISIDTLKRHFPVNTTIQQ